MIHHPKFASNERLNTIKRVFETADELLGQDLWERLMWRDLSKALREVWRLSTPGCGSYRPDLHYMRGPGPKWHAKYDGLYHKNAPATAPTARALHEAAQHHA
jgi:hypothetical protein